MRAIVYMTYTCETCGNLLMRMDDGTMKHWENPHCEHSGKRFRPPVVEMEEVQKPTKAGGA